MTSDLESILISDMQAGKPIELERALLVVSGADTEEKISEYRQKLDRIIAGFSEYISTLPKPRMASAAQTARALHNYLWQSKPNRSEDGFLLTEVADALLADDPAKPAGDCLGFTSLYTVLGLRLGLELSVLRIPGHTLSILHDQGRNYLIETANPNCFDYRRAKSSQGIDLGIGQMSEVSLSYLVISALNRRGFAKEEEGDYVGAIADYSKAIELDPNYAHAYNNRGNAKKKMMKMDGHADYSDAIADYDKAVELEPDHATAYYNRGAAKYAMGDTAGALVDYDEAIELNPYLAEAYTGRGLAKMAMGDNTGALADYDQAIELNPDYTDAYYDRGAVRYNLGDYSGAKADFTQLLKLDPDNELASKNLLLCAHPLPDPAKPRGKNLFGKIFGKRQTQ
jgi:tetratricopeptide (TPR) repeat protein